MNDRAQNVGQPFPQVLAACVALHKRHADGNLVFEDKILLQAIEERLKDSFGTYARLVSFGLPEEISAKSDPNHPGYVILSSGSSDVYLPYFLAQVFPQDGLLERICDLARSVTIGGNSVICISGSTCYLGLGHPSADVDYCEYLPLGDRETIDGLLGAMLRTDEEVVCFKVDIDRRYRWRRPWPDTVKTSKPSFVVKVQSVVSSSAWRQVAFITELHPLGVQEVTNRLVALDPGRVETGEAIHSFAAQEAPILAEGAWIPRSLTDPLEIGRYLHWLSSNVKTHLSKARSNPRSMVKAIRRCISATRLLMMREEGNALLQLLKEGARLAVLHDRCELFASVNQSPDVSVSQFVQPLRNTIDGLRGGKTDRAEYYCQLTPDEDRTFMIFAREARKIVSGVSRSIDLTLGVA